MSSLFRSHFTFSFTSICSLAPPFLNFLHHAHTCSPCLPLQLHNVRCITIREAPCSAHKDSYKSGAARIVILSSAEPKCGAWLLVFFCFFLLRASIFPLYSHLASSDRQWEHRLTEKVQHRPSRMGFYWMWGEEQEQAKNMEGGRWWWWGFIYSVHTVLRKLEVIQITQVIAYLYQMC